MTKSQRVRNSLSNPRLNGANVCYDLNLPFQGVAQLKLNEGSEDWCTRQDLNLKPSDPKSDTLSN